MNHSTLKSLRSLLFFTQDEAAALVGGVSTRSWNYWESGNRPIPLDVVDKISALVLWRTNAIKEAKTIIHESRKKTGQTNPILISYKKEDWLKSDRDEIFWKPHCSVIATVASDESCSVVTFDFEDYARFLGKRKDSETLRGEWAARKMSMN